MTGDAPRKARCPSCGRESRFEDVGSASGRSHYRCPKCGPGREKNPHAVALGALGGRAAAAAMTPEERTARAEKAGNASWNKKKNGGVAP